MEGLATTMLAGRTGAGHTVTPARAGTAVEHPTAEAAGREGLTGAELTMKLTLTGAGPAVDLASTELTVLNGPRGGAPTYRRPSTR